jgi:hypothetical protein
MSLMLVDAAAAGQRRLTLDEAEQLALAALSTETKHPASVSLIPPPIPPKNGATFDVVWAEPAPASPHVRALLIDIDTGDVWEPVRCERVTTRALETAQRRLRRQLTISSADVKRLRAQAKEHGCSNLVDERPKPADFHLARLVRVTMNEKKTSYRYTIMVGGDMSYIAFSPTPLRVREGEIKFSKTKTSMYVIDDDGSIQEMQDEPNSVPPPPPKRSPERWSPRPFR